MSVHRVTVTPSEDRGFLRATVGDRRPLLCLLGLSLALSGLLALYLSCTGQFLPNDERFQGRTTEQLCAVHGCRVVRLMIHDRVSFGGALVALGSVYVWLAGFPLRQGQAWAWWLFLVTGSVEFGSFFAYPGYGYLVAFHGVATLVLFPWFVAGLVL